MNPCERIDVETSAEFSCIAGEHDGLDVVAGHGLAVLLAEPVKDRGVQGVDGRVADGDERHAVGAHLHGHPHRRPRRHGRPAGSLAVSVGEAKKR